MTLAASCSRRACTARTATAHTTKVGFPGLDIQVHNCWFFFPWHRLYTYFHERILGKLIGDDTFALPFWNWDAPGGMTLPAIYTNTSSPLYDERRNPAHQPPSLLDLDFSDTDPNMARDLQTEQVHVPPDGFGRQEEGALPGSAVPRRRRAGPWRGVPRERAARSAPRLGRRPAAAQRRGHGQLLLRGARPGVLRALARPRRRQHGLRRRRLARRHLPLLRRGGPPRARPRPRLPRPGRPPVHVPGRWPAVAGRQAGQDRRHAGARHGRAPGEAGQDRDSVRVAVTRPRVSRSRKEKDDEEEVLGVEGIEVADHSRYVKFDVYVNQCQGGDGTAAAECAGSVALTPHVVQHGDKEEAGAVKTVARFGITDLLDEIGADGDKTIIVSFVPRCAGDVVTVGGVSIEYVK